MKTAVIAIVILFTSCSGYEIQPVIVYKSYHTFTGKQMPRGLCRYAYKRMSNGNSIEFEDSCNKYEIGSIINFPSYKPTHHD
jgi:hypothetical protein